MQTNTSIFIASGGETEVAIPYSNTNYLSVKLNGVRLTPGEDYTSANNTHIGNMLALAAADVLTVTEYKQHTANLVNRSSGGGGGGYSFQGTVSGYSTGGELATPSVHTNTIDKFSLASDANATDVGDTVDSLRETANQKSSTHGYMTGGVTNSVPYAEGAYNINTIQKFSFSSDGNATDSADLAQGTYAHAGQSSSENGYTTGGFAPSLSPASLEQIQKFPFSSDTNATCIASVFEHTRDNPAGHSSSDHGYQAGGTNSSFSSTLTIQKFPFSSDTNATDVGDLTICRKGVSGTSSSTNGYTHGGYNAPGGYHNVIDKFPFSSDGNATDVGDLTQARQCVAGQSSTASGYSSGGHGPSPTDFNIIDKYPFSSDSNASDVGDLTQARRVSGGTQV